MVQEFVAKNRSKFDQAFVQDFRPKDGAICIFAQDFLEPKFHTHHLTFPELIEGVLANRAGRPVYIKPHPAQSFDEAAKLMTYHAPDDGIEVTTHSIHGLLESASVAVTLTSAVAFEANLHKVPAILGGQTDFHHNAVTVTHQSGIKAALAEAESREFHFEKYLVWFLTHGLIRPKHADAARKRIETLLTLKGYPVGPSATNGLF